MSLYRDCIESCRDDAKRRGRTLTVELCELVLRDGGDGERPADETARTTALRALARTHPGTATADAAALLDTRHIDDVLNTPSWVIAA